MSLCPEGVKAIQDSEKTHIIIVGEQEYTSRQVHLPPREPSGDHLAVYSLTGLVDFANVAADSVRTFIVVVDQRTVLIVDRETEGRYNQRATYCVAHARDVLTEFGFSMGQFIAHERFLIALRALFVETDALADLVQTLGTIKSGEAITTKDDGFSQEVVAQTGVARVGNVTIPNPIQLRPFRTFSEVDQPDSPFLLRLQKNKDGMPTCALFECDGGKWKNSAMQSIKTWLQEQLPGFTILA